MQTATQLSPQPTTAPLAVSPSPVARFLQIEADLQRVGANLDRVCAALDEYGDEVREPIRRTLEEDALNLERAMADLSWRWAEALEDVERELALLAPGLRAERGH